MPTEPTWEETTAVEEPTWDNTTAEQETASPGFLGPTWPAQEVEQPSFFSPTVTRAHIVEPPPPLLPTGTTPVTGGGPRLSLSAPAQMPLPRLPFMGGGQEPVPISEGMMSPIVPLPEAPSVKEQPVTKPEKAFFNYTQSGMLLKSVLGEEVASQVARETYNQLKSVPEFFTSLSGIGATALGTATGPLGAIAKTAMTAGFTTDTLRNLVNHVEQSYGDWDQMSDTEKARAIVKGIGLGTLGTLLVHGTAKQTGSLAERGIATEQTAAKKLSPTTLGIPRLLENLANVWGRPTGLPARPVAALPPMLPPHVAPPVAQRPEDAAIAAAEPILPQAAEAVRETKGVSDASEISKTAEVYGDVRPQPVEGIGQVPVEGSGAGVQPQTAGRIPEAQAVTPPRTEAERRRLLLTELTPEQKLEEQAALDEALGQEPAKPTPQAEPTPTAVPPAEPSIPTPAQGSQLEPISKTTTPEQGTQALVTPIQEAVPTVPPAAKPISDLYGTLTPAIKSAQREIRDGPLSYVESMSPGDALAEVAKVRQLWSKNLERLRRVAALKEDINAKDAKDRDYWQAKSGKPMSGDMWATQYGIPQSEQYLKGLDATERAIKRVVATNKKRANAKAKAAGEEEPTPAPAEAPAAPTEPFLGKTKAEWTLEYYKSLSPENRRAARAQVIGALATEGGKTKVTQESKPPQVLKAIHELLDLREKKKAATTTETPPTMAVQKASEAAPSPAAQINFRNASVRLTNAGLNYIIGEPRDAAMFKSMAKSKLKIVQDYWKAQDELEASKQSVPTELPALRKADIADDPRLEMPGITKQSKPNSLIVALRDLDSVPVKEIVLKSSGDPLTDANTVESTIKKYAGQGRISLRESLAVTTGPNGRAILKFGISPRGMTWSSAKEWVDLIESRKAKQSETPLQSEGGITFGPGAQTRGEPPYAAAQQLTDQLRATPQFDPNASLTKGQKAMQYVFNLRQKIADTWAEGKSTFERAVGNARVTAETLKDTARGVRAITDLDRRIGELDWLLQKSAGQSRNMGKAIIEQQKSKTTREAVALWIDAGGDVQAIKDTLANLPEGTHPRIRRALETAVNLPPEAIQFAQQLEQFYGIRLQDARQSEIFEHALDNYFTHIWQKEANMPDKLRQAYSTGRVSDYFQFARQRKLPMFLDGILQGKTPELDPAKILPYYNYALDRAIASRHFVKELSDVNAPDGRPAVLPMGTARKLEPNEQGTEGGMFINPKGKGELGKDYHVIDHPAMRKWKWLGADEQGNPVMYRSDLAANPLVHERLARMLDQRLATPSKVGKALLRASTEVKGFKLGLLSAFHQVHVGSHALFHWTSPFKTTEIDWESPAVRYAVEKGHLKLAGDAAQIANFSEGLLSPGLVHKVPIVGPWSRAYSEWLFTDYIPRLKLKTFENALPRNLAWFSKDIAAGKITKEQVAARVGDAVNNAYGELNHWFLGKYGRSPQFQRILRGIFLAPDFGEARLRFVEKAFTKYGWEERMAFATMFLTLYAGARVANWLSHGDPETDTKNAFRVKVKIPGKDQMEWVSMRSVVGDVAHALTGFGQFMYVRLNPLYSRTVSDILFQRDVYGRKLSFGDIAFKRPAQQLVPINFTGLTREDQSLWESAVTSAGLQVQHDVPALDIGKLKRKWLLSNPDPKLKAMGERNEAELFPPSDYSPLRRALLSGDMKKAGEAYDALKTEKGKKSGDILDAMKPFTGGKEVNGVYQEVNTKPIGGQIGADAEKKFLKSLTPAERKLYAQAIEERKRIYARFLELLKTR